MKEKNNNFIRIEYLDLLRIIATIGVIAIHISAQNWYDTNIRSFEWNVFNVWDSIARCSVPIFVMISGAIFFTKECTVKQLYSNYILRIVIAFIFWSLLYAIIFYRDKGINAIITQLLLGHFHLWFLFMIIVLYMLVPILKKIIESRNTMKYFLLIYFILQMAIPTFSAILNSLQLRNISNIINTNIGNIQLVFGYSGYFVLGYYLCTTNFTKKCRLIIYLLGIIGIVSTIALSIMDSRKLENPSSVYYNYFFINVAIVAVSAFVFSKYNFKSNKILKNISKCCFGIYLVHAMIFEVLNLKWNINALSFNPIFSVPIIVLIVFVISLTIIKIIGKIPLLNRYII